MNKDNFFILAAILFYFIILIIIGIRTARRANESTENYFLGGRTLGPWVTALSAEASDMSGWLLMGLPGVAYFTGASDAAWTAIGLAVGTYLNWKFIAKPLRVYTEKTNSITLPDYFSNRFNDSKRLLMGVSALLILFFFCIYVGSCFVTCGKLFSALFGWDYVTMMIVGAVIVFIYTLMGGFLAGSFSDMLQGSIMFVVLVLVVLGTFISIGGFENAVAILSQIPGFLSLTNSATPVLDPNGVQLLDSNGFPLFDAKAAYPILGIASALAWGLGYFGMPQVLVRFMAIKDKEQIKFSRKIAVTWVVISLIASIGIGILGRALMPAEFLTSWDAEAIFISLSVSLLPAFLAGVAVAGILAATMSSADAYMLIAAGSISVNLFKGIIKKDATNKQVLIMSRIVMTAILVLGIFIAMDENSSIFNIVSYAWAGFGAALGPVVLASLFWRNTTKQGAFAGMVTGALTVVIWRNLIAPLGGILAIYELLPGFILALIAIFVVSKLSPKPEKEVVQTFDDVKAELHA